MPFAEHAGISLYFEDTGRGEAVLFLHEFAGDHRSWARQVEHFSGSYRCIVPAARGYPPSDVPKHAADYGWETALADALAVLDHTDINAAHVTGLSMGAYTGLMLALRHPERVRTLVAASGGAGSYPGIRDAFIEDAEALAQSILANDTVPAQGFAEGPTRIQLKHKSEARWEEFRDHLAEHPAVGSAHTLARVQAARPSLYDFTEELAACRVPALLMLGDEDESCIDVNLFLKRTMPTAGLVTFPKSGHLINLEDPAAFNAAIDHFWRAVGDGAWFDRQGAGEPFGGVGLNRED